MKEKVTGPRMEKYKAFLPKVKINYFLLFKTVYLF